MRKTRSNALPAKLEKVGDGAFWYHYDIEETERTIHHGGDEEPQTRKEWECYQVKVWPPLSANVLTKAVIAATWDASVEQKLVNEYNMAQLGLYEGEEAERKIAAYKEYLAERSRLKAQCDSDWAEYLSNSQNADKTAS